MKTRGRTGDGLADARLARTLTPFAMLCLTLSAATPASSAFLILPDVLRTAGTGALISLALAGIIAFLVAQTYAELASAIPHAGGEYAMAARLIGPRAGAAMLALNGGNTLLVAAVMARGAAQYLAPGQPEMPAALLAIAAGTVAGVARLRTSAAVTGVFLAGELVALAIVVALGLNPPARPLGPMIADPAVLADGALAAAPIAAILLGVTVALFAFDGYGTAIYFAEELTGHPRRIARVVLAAAGVMVLALMAVAVALLLGAPDLRALLAADDMVGGLVTVRLGPGPARWFGLIVGLAILNAVIATVLIGARQLWASARDGIWGARSGARLSAVDARRGVPTAATLAFGAAAAALCLLPMRTLLVLTGTGLTAVYAGLALALLRGRATGALAGAPHRAPLGAAAPVLLLVALAGVAAATALDAKTGLPSLLATTLIGGFAALVGKVPVSLAVSRGSPLTGREGSGVVRAAPHDRWGQSERKSSTHPRPLPAREGCSAIREPGGAGGRGGAVCAEMCDPPPPPPCPGGVKCYSRTG